MTTATLIVDSAGAAAASANRLDLWLAGRLPQHSRTAIQRWIKDGRVFVNDRLAKANQRLAVGDQILVSLPEVPSPAKVAAEAIPLTILYEDFDIVVVDKPAGLVVHPAPGHASGTLVNAILHHIPDLAGISGEMRPGIVHRLDKDTSGTMVIAKHEAALRHLQAQFKSRKVKKVYAALVEGKLEENQGHIVAPIGRDIRNRKRQAVIFADKTDFSKARPATTEFAVMARYSASLQNDLGRGAFTFVHAHPITGRTHQIRVHFAWLGHPLVGDPIYGLRRQRLVIPRLFLHALRLGFSLPSTGEWVEFHAGLPSDLEDVLVHLEQTSNSR